MSLHVIVEGAEEVKASWRRLAAFPGGRLGRCVRDAADSLLGHIQHTAPMRTGKLRSSASRTPVQPWRTHSAACFVVVKAKHAPFVLYGTRPHIIRARGDGHLRFQIGGQWISTPIVHHPGTAPQDYLSTGIATGQAVLVMRMTAAVEQLKRDFEG